MIFSYDLVSVLTTESPVRYIAFSPDGGLLATAGGDGAVRLWRTIGRGKNDPNHLCPGR